MKQLVLLMIFMVEMPDIAWVLSQYLLTNIMIMMIKLYKD